MSMSGVNHFLLIISIVLVDRATAVGWLFQGAVLAESVHLVEDDGGHF